MHFVVCVATIDDGFFPVLSREIAATNRKKRIIIHDVIMHRTYGRQLRRMTGALLDMYSPFSCIFLPISHMYMYWLLAYSE